MTNIRYDIYKCKDMHAGTHTQVLFPNGNQNSCIEICCLHNGGWIGTCREFSNYLQPSFKAWPLAGISLGAWPRPAYISMFTTLASSFFCCKTSTYLPLRLRLGYFIKPWWCCQKIYADLCEGEKHDKIGNFYAGHMPMPLHEKAFRHPDQRGTGEKLWCSYLV